MKTSVSNVQMTFFGKLVDSYSNIVPGQAKKAGEVHQAFLDEITRRNLPAVDIGAKLGSVPSGILRWGLNLKPLGIQVSPPKDDRLYIFAETFPGATSIVSIQPAGNDLYVDWSTHIKRLPNAIFMVIGLFALVFPACALVTGALGQLAGFSRFFNDPRGTLIGAIVGLCGTIFLLIFAVVVGAFLFALMAFPFTLLGLYLTGDPFHLLAVQPNWFETEDIVALNIAVHQSLLVALQAAEIDTSRIKVDREYQRPGQRGARAT
jgi:hypothetical protein